jgi:CRISPR-associated protein Cas6
VPIVDLLFPALGGRVAVDHGYPLYAAISRILPRVHSGELPVAFAPLSGLYLGEGRLALDPGMSFLRARLDHAHVPALLALTGKTLSVRGTPVLLGAPQIALLTPRPALASRCVLIDDRAVLDAKDDEPFLESARRRLTDLGIKGRAEVPRIAAGRRRGEPRRVVIRIHERALVGYSLVVRDLDDADSMRLQEVGLGSRRRMGAGMFVPAEEDRS